MKYPMIEKLGLKLWQNCTWEGSDGKGWLDTCIHATDLESLLASAQRVYGCLRDTWSELEDRHCDHTALLIAVEEIRKGVTKAEVLEFIESVGYSKLAERIKTEGIRD